MLTQGAVEVDIGQHIAWHHFGGWKTRFRSGVTMQCQTKGFLERHIRRRLAQWPNVTLRAQSDVSGLQMDAGRIRGVRLRNETKFNADLVIDAGGRNSQPPHFLKAIDCAPPQLTELPVNIGYASQIFGPGRQGKD